MYNSSIKYYTVTTSDKGTEMSRIMYIVQCIMSIFILGYMTSYNTQLLYVIIKNIYILYSNMNDKLVDAYIYATRITCIDARIC